MTVRLTELTEKLSRSLGRVEVVGLEGDGVASDIEVTGIVTDSRRVTPGTVFCALRGERFDGNDFTGDAALHTGQIAGAALDVIEPEPLPPEHPLFSLENCILTPHVAARLRS